MSPLRRLKLRRRKLRVLPLLAACAVCVGATSQSCKLGRNAKDRNDFSDFSVSLQLRDDADTDQTTFDQQDRVHFVLSVTNTADKKKTLEFSSTRQADFAILTDDRAEEIKWVDSSTGSAQQTPTELEFAAGETKTFTAEAVLVESNGDFFPKGDYQAVGALLVDFPDFATAPLTENDLASEPLPFTID